MLPPGMYSGRASALIERSLLVYKRSWLLFVSGIFEPLFYLLAFQYGFGRLVGEVAGPGGVTMSYIAFVAPALLASSARNGAVLDSTFNVFFKYRYAKLYDAMLSTPIGPFDIAIGEISWAVMRGGLYAVAFLAGAFRISTEIARGAFVPSLVGRSQLVAANSRLQASRPVTAFSAMTFSSGSERRCGR